ncbi:uncharacterized protein LOC133889443 [Phragmites australis]|uniref:uncharacterized protein LOC133889443 n=1 Tax=Phragmites australis TaxID=29695 RepID=UPI002D77E826|nr:uncharacterized protein LOC133889443 [Phragmites australis]
MALCVNPERATIQAELPELDAQGLVDRPPTGAAKVQEAPALAPAPEPSRPAEPGQADAATEAGTAKVAAEAGTAEAAAVSGPVDAAAEAGTQPSPEHLAPVEPTPDVLSPGRMMALQPSGTPNPPEEARGEPSAQPAHGQPADPLPVAIESVRVAVERLGAVVDVEVAQLEAERARLDTERAHLTTAWRAFKSRHVVQRAANEKEQGAMEEARAEAAREQKFLEDTRAEVTREREILENTRAEEASRQQAAEALAMGRWAQEREEANAEGDLRRWEEDVSIREVDTKITAADLGAREDLLTRREFEAAEAAAAATAKEEQIVKHEAELTARERALSEMAAQVK